MELGYSDRQLSNKTQGKPRVTYKRTIDSGIRLTGEMTNTLLWTLEPSHLKMTGGFSLCLQTCLRSLPSAQALSWAIAPVRRHPLQVSKHPIWFNSPVYPSSSCKSTLGGGPLHSVEQGPWLTAESY